MTCLFCLGLFWLEREGNANEDDGGLTLVPETELLYGELWGFFWELLRLRC